MNELEKIQRYIDNTHLTNLSRYQMGLHDIMGLNEIEDAFERMVMAFEYGIAKGWRAAKASEKK